MWPRNAAVACKRSRTCKRAKDEADGTYGPLPNNTNRGDSDGMLFSGLPRPNYSSGPSLAP